MGGLNQLKVQEGATPVAVGRFLGLTGQRLNAEDCLRFGVGTHFVKQENLPELHAHAARYTGSCSPHEVAAYLEESNLLHRGSSSGALEPAIATQENVGKIESWFGSASATKIEDAIRNVRAASGTENSAQKCGFAAAVSKTLAKMSPLSLKLTWEAMKRHESVPFEQALIAEYRMACGCMRAQPEADFREGVTALLVEKRKANWAHASVDEVSDELIESY